MLQDIEQATYSQPAPKRTLLDQYKWIEFELNLFYEKKQLCLELINAAEHRALGRWTFCSGSRRMDSLKISSDLEIEVSYRPAHIAVSFCKSAKTGFLKRWLHAMERVHWSDYRLRCDGLVAVTHPGAEEVLVG